MKNTILILLTLISSVTYAAPKSNAGTGKEPSPVVKKIKAACKAEGKKGKAFKKCIDDQLAAIKAAEAKAKAADTTEMTKQ